MEAFDFEAISTYSNDHHLLQHGMHHDSKDIDEASDFEATPTYLNLHFVLQQYMYLHPKNMEDPDYEATAIHSNGHSWIRHRICLH
jgi:hypothetical protein